MHYEALEISVKEAASDSEVLHQNGLQPVIIDVREQWEWDLVAVPQSVHIPLALLFAEGLTIDPQTPVFTLCHHGMRSLKAALWLRTQGFMHAQSIKGGIEEWACQIDPSLKRY